ncbi:putative Ig domain-containing protein [Larkinella insperata]|uniref:Ig domain-containing protein n=1 Tax=Larkinella insperata TaxID=332158 RepID=A0ABW3QB80_9BACT|nr:putative Ig domain-containing protein [Larkinella insperata]
MCFAPNAHSQFKPGFSEEVYIDESGAVGFAFDKNGAMYIWTIDGRVVRVDPQSKKKSTLLDISGEVGRYDDFGLLGMALDNNFLNNGRFYLYYVIRYAPVKYQGTYARVTRYEANKDDGFRSIKPNSRQILIGAPDPNNPSKGVPGDCIVLTSSSHAGGGITMGADGSLLIPTGDGAAPAFDEGNYSETYHSQSIQNGFMTAAENIGSYRSQVDFSLSGKVLRINPDNGNGLPGNPGYDPSNPRSVKSRIFASGLRQPFRTSLRPNTGSADVNAGDPGSLYVGEVGLTDWEEINVIKKGANYGWPFEEGQVKSTRPYNKTQYKPSIPFTKPVISWRSGPGQVNRNGTITEVKNTPAGALPGYCAVGGGWHPGGGNYPAEYQNAYYFGDFNGGWISKISFDSDNQPQPATLTKLLDGGSSYQYITCIAFNPIDKNMYYLRYPENGGERIRRVTYSGSAGGSPPVAIILSDKNNGPSPLTVKFTGNTSYDPEGKALTYAWDFGDKTTSTAANPEHTFTTTSTSTTYIVKLTVTDPEGKTNQTEKTITVSSASNAAPVIVSTSVDDKEQMDLSEIRNIDLSAVINDETPANQLSYKWTVSLFHNDHQHDDFITTAQTATASLPPIGCDGTLTFWYGVKLEVTDAGGLKTETMRYIYPNCAGNTQTITFNPIADRAPNSAAFTPQATASSGKPVVFYVIEGPAVIAEGKVFLTGRLGKVTVRAAQHGGDGFQPARPAERSFNVVSNASDQQPPTLPTNLVISDVTQNSMRLTWNASTDNVSVAGYEVYQNNVKIADVTSGTAYNVTNLAAGTEYYFFIRAVDPTGNVSGNSNTATETTTAPPANTPPVAPTVAPLSATVNAAYTSAALPVFTDANNDALTYTLTGLPAGLSFNASTRVISGTPTAKGTSTLAYSATDGKSNPVSTAITLTVNEAANPPANTPPVAPTVSPLSATVNAAYTSAALPVFTDANNDALTYTLTGLPAGLSFNASTRVISGTPTAKANTTLTYSATDGKSDPVTTSITLTINDLETPANRVPVAPTVAPLSATVNVGYAAAALPVFTDADKDALTYTLTGLPAGMSFNTSTRVISGTPTASGSFNLTYSANDGKAKTDLTVMLNVATGGTVIVGNFEGYLDQVNCTTISGWVFNYDSPNAPYTVEFLAATGSNPTIESATVVGTTVANIFRTDLLNAGKGNGVHGYSFAVPNSIKNNQQQTIWGRVEGSTYVLMWAPKTLTCQGSGTPANQPPTAPTVANLSATVNVAYTSAALPAFTDANNDALTYTLTGLPAGLSFNASTRVISGTPTAKANTTLTYSATDGKSNPVSTSFTLTVNETDTPPTNQPPVAPTVAALSATVNVAYTSAALPVFTDANNDALTYTLTGLPAGLSFNASTRVISGTPTASGSFPLVYSASDGQAKTDLTLTLNVATGGVVVTGNFEGYLDQVTCTTISGWVWDRDKPNTPLSVEFLEGATVATATPIGTNLANIFRTDLVNAGKGNGVHGYSFATPESIKDNQAHTIWARVEGSTYVLMWAPKTLTCQGSGTPANQPPTAPTVANLSATVNVAYTSAALPAFTDANNDALTYTLTGLPAGLSFNASTRVISGTPTAKANTTLTYSATDGKSNPVSTSFTLTVNETDTPPTNQPPVAPTVAALSATVNVAYTSAALPVFTDANNDALTYTLTGLPAGLSFNASTRVISGTLTASGSFSLVYSASDGQAKTDLTLTLNVATGGLAPAANFDGYLTQEVNCNTLSGWAFDRTSVNSVVAIEFFEGPSIAAGKPIGTIAADVFKQHLLDAGKGNGVHWYDFPIPESLKDGQNHTIWARVQGSEFVLKWAPKIINCAGTGTPPTNQPPVAPTVANLTATINVAYTSAALPAFTDANNDALTYTLTGLPAGLSFNAGTRVLSGTPTTQGSFNLTYSATDGKSNPVAKSLILTVSDTGTPVDPNPTTGVTGPGNYEGYLDVVNCDAIQGWIWDRDKPNAVITVEFLDGTTVIGKTDAGNYRQDLKDAGKGNGAHGYAFTVPASLKDGQPHVIVGRVPNNSGYTLKWSPKTLTCPNGGREAAPNAELSTDLTVTPNPSTGRFVISYRLASQQKGQLQVVDVLGRTAWQQEVVGNGQRQQQTVDLSGGSIGIHFVQMKTDGQQVIKRLLINR